MRRLPALRLFYALEVLLSMPTWIVVSVPVVRAPHRSPRRLVVMGAALAEEAEPELVGPREAEWFDRLGAELDNLWVALPWSQARDEAELGLRLAGALCGSGPGKGYSARGACG